MECINCEIRMNKIFINNEDCLICKKCGDIVRLNIGS